MTFCGSYRHETWTFDLETVWLYLREENHPEVYQISLLPIA
jgi:hypothetical protein